MQRISRRHDRLSRARRTRGFVGLGGWPAVALCGLLGFTLGCATPVQAPPLLVVKNALGRPVESIQHKRCAAQDPSFAPLEDSRLNAGQTGRFALLDDCVDLVALDDRGRIVGEQRGLSTQNGVRWTLRR